MGRWLSERQPGKWRLTHFVTRKFCLLVAVPVPVETLIRAVLDPVGTCAVSWVLETPEKTVAATLPNETRSGLPRLDPVIVTVVPTGPLLGVKPVMVGGPGVTVSVAPGDATAPTVAVTDVVPGPTPRAVPVLPIVAIELSPVAHVTPLVRLCVLPSE